MIAWIYISVINWRSAKKMNSDIEDKEIVRVNNWDEVYQKIQEMKETCKEQEDVR